MNKNKPFLKKVLFYLIYILIISIVLLVSAEILLRFIKNPTSQLENGIKYTDDERIYILKPNAHIIFTGLHNELKDTVIWHINSQGIRNDKFIRPKTFQKCRIATYGNSETFGWSVNLAHTFQKQIEVLDKNIECVNLGVPGYNIGQVAKHIGVTEKLINPDIIIYLINPNDVDAPLHLSKLNSGLELSQRIRFLFEIYRVYRDEQRRRNPVAISNFITGSIFKASLDNTSPLGFGYSDYYYTLKVGSNRFAYLKNGYNVSVIDDPSRKVSGFAGKNAMETLEKSLVYGVEQKGKGTLVYLVDDPLFRSFWENGKLLFSNAVFMVGQD